MDDRVPVSRRRILQIAAVGAGAWVVPGRSWAAPAHGFVPSPGDTEVVTTCNQCFLGCGLIATVRGGRLHHLRGNPAAPTNRGRCCPKAQAAVGKLEHPERLTEPLIRVGRRGEGRFVQASWDEALERVVKGVRAAVDGSGARSVAWWQNVDNERPLVFERFMHALGSPNFFSHPGSFGPALAAGLAVGPAYMVPDYAHAQAILIAGTNPLATKELCWSARELLDARDRGAMLIVADPRLSETAMHADLWLPVRPGTDGVLLAGMCRWLIDHGAWDKAFVSKHAFGFDALKASLAPYDVETVCRATGLERDRFEKAIGALAGKRTVVDAFSGLSFQAGGTWAGAMRMALATLLGSVDTEGGLLPLSVPRVKWPALEPKVSDPGGTRLDEGMKDRLPLPFGPLPRHPSFDSIGPVLPTAVLEGRPYPLRALFVCNANPVYSMPRAFKLVEALEALDLVVTLDAFPSETSMYADVILPAATFLESTELNDVFPPYQGVALRQPVLPPRGESRPVQDVVIDLAHRLGLGAQFPWKSYPELLQAQCAKSPVKWEALERDGFVDLGYRPGQRLEAGLETPSGKIELVSSVIDYLGEPRLGPAGQLDDAPPKDRPFHLITYRLPYHANSRTAANPYLAAIRSENLLLVNPAAGLGVASGERVRVRTTAGSVEVRVELTEGIRPDTVALSHHFGHTAYSKGARGQGAWYNGLPEARTDRGSWNVVFQTFAAVEKVPA